MAKKEYDWALGEPPPFIGSHSLAKHKILREYLVKYVTTVAANPRMDVLRLTLVDAFAGGGLYRRHGVSEYHHGSPLIMLEAVREAAARLSVGRRKPFHVDAKFLFVEREPENLRYLEQTLKLEGYGSRIDSDIFLFNASFEDKIDDIVAFVGARGSGRSLFLLDQYGYVDVPLQKIRFIFKKLPRAEVVITFAVDWLIDYLSDTVSFQKSLERIGIAHYMDWKNIRALKSAKNWRFLIQSQLHKALIAASSARFYNPFFIHSPESNRDYWLVHLCSHVRARDVMNQLHWQFHTYFRHYGKAGLNMLGYDPEHDEAVTGMHDIFGFDDSARTQTLLALAEQLPNRIHVRPEGQTFDQLIMHTCNETPASTVILREALGESQSRREIEIVGPNGERRRKAGPISFKDVIFPLKQTYFIFPKDH
jgi:three-Cys-motif partner protein